MQTVNNTTNTTTQKKRNKEDILLHIGSEFHEIEMPQNNLILTKPQSNSLSFPLKIFPSATRDFIEELEVVLGYPTDYTAGALLFALSIAIGNSRTFELKKGIKSKCNLFLITVGRPGTNKSNPFQFALQQIRAIERQIEKEYRKDLALFEAEEAKPLADRSEDVKKPELINYILNDFTAEVLAKELSKNERGLGVFADEILGWLLNLNKYSGGSNEEAYLSLWNAFEYKVNRVGKEQITIKNPFVSIAGTIQPERMRKAFAGKESNGFTDRVLFIFPDGLKSPKWNDEEIDLNNAEHLNEIILDLFRKLEFSKNDFSQNIPQVVIPSKEAKRTLIEWQRKFATKNDNEDEETQSIGAKIENYLLRFNLLIHLLSWANGEEENEFISSKETADKSIILAEYFMNQALKVRDYIYSNDTLEGLAEDKKIFIDNLPKCFRTDQAKAQAEKLKMPHATMYRFLGNSKYFKKISQGVYENLN